MGVSRAEGITFMRFMHGASALQDVSFHGILREGVTAQHPTCTHWLGTAGTWPHHSFLGATRLIDEARRDVGLGGSAAHNGQCWASRKGKDVGVQVSAYRFYPNGRKGAKYFLSNPPLAFFALQV